MIDMEADAIRCIGHLDDLDAAVFHILRFIAGPLAFPVDVRKMQQFKRRIFIGSFRIRPVNVQSAIGSKPCVGIVRIDQAEVFRLVVMGLCFLEVHMAVGLLDQSVHERFIVGERKHLVIQQRRFRLCTGSDPRIIDGIRHIVCRFDADDRSRRQRFLWKLLLHLSDQRDVGDGTYGQRSFFPRDRMYMGTTLHLQPFALLRCQIHRRCIGSEEVSDRFWIEEAAGSDISVFIGIADPHFFTAFFRFQFIIWDPLCRFAANDRLPAKIRRFVHQPQFPCIRLVTVRLDHEQRFWQGAFAGDLAIVIHHGRIPFAAGIDAEIDRPQRDRFVCLLRRQERPILQVLMSRINEGLADHIAIQQDRQCIVCKCPGCRPVRMIRAGASLRRFPDVHLPVQRMAVDAQIFVWLRLIRRNAPQWRTVRIFIEHPDRTAVLADRDRDRISTVGPCPADRLRVCVSIGGDRSLGVADDLHVRARIGIAAIAAADGGPAIGADRGHLCPLQNLNRAGIAGITGTDGSCPAT